MRTRLLTVLLAMSSAAFGGDREFDHVVNAIESHYGVSRTHIPFMGLANFFLNAARPAGASGFKLAIFEDLKSAPGSPEQDSLDRFMNGLSSKSLHRLVRVHSRRNGESTYIYTGEAGQSTKMLVATFQPNEATVVEVKVDMHTLLRWIEDPERAGKSLGASDDR